MNQNSNKKIALVHDWLTGMRGGEKVLEIFCRIFPSADLYTLLHIKGTVSQEIEKHKIRTSYLQKLPFVKKKYRYYLPIMPNAIESLDLSGYDLVISTSHCVAKGCRKAPGATHLCCCFTPMRYIWDQYDHYFGRGNSSYPAALAMKAVRDYLQKWDVESSKNVNEFIAISNFVAERILKYYGRSSTVIYPPVDSSFFTPGNSDGMENSPFYLVVSALAPYKRIDIAIDAFNRTGKNLKIIGTGQSEKKLKSIAKSNIEFLGWQSQENLLKHYRTCKALIFPGIEDYGIVPLEAMSCGKPVIVYRAGGALETVVENKTALFFNHQTADSLINSIEEFEGKKWDPTQIRQHAEKFGINRYSDKLKSFITEKAGN